MIARMPYLNTPTTKFSLFQRILSYFMLGIAFILGLGFVILSFIVMIIGAMVLLIYVGIDRIIRRYRPTRSQQPTEKPPSQGRTIDHDDL